MLVRGRRQMTCEADGERPRAHSKDRRAASAATRCVACRLAPLPPGALCSAEHGWQVHHPAHLGGGVGHLGLNHARQALDLRPGRVGRGRGGAGGGSGGRVGWGRAVLGSLSKRATSDNQPSQPHLVLLVQRRNVVLGRGGHGRQGARGEGEGSGRWRGGARNAAALKRGTVGLAQQPERPAGSAPRRLRGRQERASGSSATVQPSLQLPHILTWKG